MIDGVVLENSNSWLDEVSHFNPKQQTWLVSSLPSKLNIQETLFSTHSILAENSVLRISEFWQILIKRQNPHFKLVSSAWLRSYLKESLQNEEEDWLRVPGASKTLLDYISQLVPILLLDNSQMIYSWLQENPTSLIRWGKWYGYAHKYFHEFLEKNWVLESWLPEILLTQNEMPSWKNEIILDLGTELTSTEAKIIKRFADQTKIKVFCPANILDGSEEFKKIKESYDLFQDWTEKKEKKISNIQIHRFSTALSEVKDVVSQVRVWIQEEGVKAHEIAIYASDIEIYWPILSPYFETEGIPCTKNKILNGNGFLQIQSWLSRLKVKTQKVSTEDLEMNLFSFGSPPISYSEFKKMYGLILTSEQLNRIQIVSEYYNDKFPLNKSISRDEFLFWALSNYQQHFQTDILEIVVQTFLQQTRIDIQFKPSTWVQLLEEFCSQIEIIKDKGQPFGIVFENLGYNHRTKIKRQYFLGLSESLLLPSSGIALSTSEKDKIERDLGVALPSRETRNVEFDLMWGLDKENCKSIISFAQSQIDGEPDSPSVIWLKLAIQNQRNLEEINIPKLSRWDLLQKNYTKNSDDLQTISQKFIARDLGKWSPEKKELRIKKLSVSRLESFLECPAIFMFESLFKLRDVRILDLDADPLDKGRLTHGVLQKIVDSSFKIKNEDELNLLIEDVRIELKTTFFDEKSWKRIKHELIEISKKFIEFEINWRQQFPSTQTLATELKFKTYWNREKNKFTTINSNAENLIEFNGSIDRIDQDSLGNAVVLDYKSSDQSHTHYNKWIEKGQLQLPIYSYLLENGFTELKNFKVLGMGYFGIKEMNRTKGLWCLEGDDKMFAINKRSNNFMSREELKTFWMLALEVVEQSIHKMEEGLILTQPRDKTTCETCDWRTACRAPHLN